MKIGIDRLNRYLGLGFFGRFNFKGDDGFCKYMRPLMFVRGYEVVSGGFGIVYLCDGVTSVHWILC